MDVIYIKLKHERTIVSKFLIPDFIMRVIIDLHLQQIKILANETCKMQRANMCTRLKNMCTHFQNILLLLREQQSGLSELTMGSIFLQHLMFLVT